MTPRTKMVIINTPGQSDRLRLHPRGTARRSSKSPSEEDILILSDEIYEKLIYDDAKHVSIASLSKEPTI